MTEDEKPYSVLVTGSQAQVVYQGEQVICSLGDAHNAQHYACLLNSAHARAFKLGYRAGKATQQN